MVRTTRQSDNVFSLAALSELENLAKDVANDFGDIAEALEEVAAAKQAYTEDRGIDSMQDVITKARNLSDKANLHIERVLKLRHAKAYVDNGGELPSMVSGGVPW